MIKKLIFFVTLALLPALSWAQESQRQYLSGHGADDMVEWDFYCTKGNNSGKWAKIGVPSCWELQGFGQFQYGNEFYGRPFPEGIADEKGMYRHEFTLPESWKDRTIELVFEGSMTDTEVTINGHKAGAVHHGAFYRFSYDITKHVNFGTKKNKLEVTVSKESTNAGVNVAERRADYWNFGGIFRPVYINAHPKQRLRHVSLSASHNGLFNATCQAVLHDKTASIRVEILDNKGSVIAKSSSSVVSEANAETGTTHTAMLALKVNNPKTWTAETPNLYRARFTLLDENGKALHQLTERFGFRTIEVRPHDGLYVNGVKVLAKGVNRHSFRPETGRTLSHRMQIEDVKLIKGMNMNAVRLSHYPADADFYDVCDSLGLYVIDELSGWHGHHDTENGRILVREMVEKSVNHPCILWWSNGNETGWNNDLNDEFGIYDPQKRPVLHPITTFRDFNCIHYNSYGDLCENLRKPEIYMPTEFLHGIYDGGHGAGLYDYWELMRKAPRCAGGFLWVLADEGVKRVDEDGRIDCHGQYAPDGIVGPHHEKEGSYDAIREIWSPIWVNTDNAQLQNVKGGVTGIGVENRYDFLNLSSHRFTYTWAATPEPSAEGGLKVIKKGECQRINVAPHCEGTLQVPSQPKGADVLLITATGTNGEEVFTWSLRASQNTDVKNAPEPKQKAEGLKIVQKFPHMQIDAGGRRYKISRFTGYLEGVEIGEKAIAFDGGPRLLAMQRGDRQNNVFTYQQERVKVKRTAYEEYADDAKLLNIDIDSTFNDRICVTVRYEMGSLQKVEWTFWANGTADVAYEYNFNGVVDLLGVTFNLPETEVVSKRWAGNGPYRVWQNRIHGPQYGIWENEYNDPVPGESFTYPEFKGYFSGVDWMTINTKNGSVTITPNDGSDYVGVFSPRDGSDHQLYNIPSTGISLLKYILPVRNKNHETDRIGPSSQPHFVSGTQKGSFTLRFE